MKRLIKTAETAKKSMNKPVMIATVYSYEPIIASVIQLGASQLILLKDNAPSKEQERAEQEIRKALGKYVQIKTVRTAVYDIHKVAADAVKVIDSLSADSRIVLNVSAARKTKSLGLMFAGYARSSSIEKIIYVTKESKEMITLPNMPFALTEKQKKILSRFNGNRPESLRELYNEMNISRATMFNMLKEFKKKGLMEGDNTLSVAGKIAML